MKKPGPEFYDKEDVFETYSNVRSNPQSANETMEQPTLWELIGSPNGLDVLDLGCGKALVAEKLKDSGAKNYLGIEASKRMFEAAQQNKISGFAEIRLSTIENFEYPENKYDLVISSMALHYVEDLSSLFKKLHRTLRPNGRLIFSVEHPVITSHNLSQDLSPVREAWVVDNYFSRGPRTVKWMGDEVTKYHRTIEDFFSLIQKSQFKMLNLRESEPDIKNFSDVELWKRRSRIPLFLFISAQKI